MKKIVILCTITIAATIFCTPIPPYKLGLENKKALQTFAQKKLRTALITNQTGIAQNKTRNVELLKAAGIVIKKMFVPEHGFKGKVRAEEKVENEIDQKTKIPIISLYKGHSRHTIEPHDMEDIDAFIIDLQDSGMRHYTYISTMYRILQEAAEYKKMVVILDRPNPLGNVIEGPIVEPSLISFISIAPIPVRHGMTMGELARFFNEKLLDKKTELVVIPLLNYQRSSGLGNNLLAPLSPNIARIQSVYGYSFLGLLSEIGPFDVGVGTKDAFRCILLPEDIGIRQKKWIALSLKLAHLHIKSFAHRSYNNNTKKWGSGLRLRIDNINQVSTMNSLLTITEFFKKEGVVFTFRNFDKAVGTTKVREYIQGKISKKMLMETVNSAARQFSAIAQDIYLYPNTPKPLLLT